MASRIMQVKTEGNLCAFRLPGILGKLLPRIFLTDMVTDYAELVM